MMMTVHWAYNLNVFETNFDLIITKLNFIFENFTNFHQIDKKNDLQCVLNSYFKFNSPKMMYRNMKFFLNRDPISSWAGDQ